VKQFNIAVWIDNCGWANILNLGYFTAMIRRLILIFISFSILYSQNPSDKSIETCGHVLSAAKWLNTESTLTVNQEKIDVTYYRIDLNIDIDAEEIDGSVLVNGWIGMDQPDSIELDFADEMIVDSVKFYGELCPFVHESDYLKVPAPETTIPEGYSFSVEVFYHGTPPYTGFGAFNFDTHANIDHIWTLSEPYGARDWWPCKDDPSDKADSVDIIITVPEEQIVASNGILVSETNVGNERKQYHWQETYPICTYLISVTTYPYTVWQDEYIAMNGDTLPLNYYVYPDHYESVYDNYLLTNDMMEVFAQRFGEYPFMGEKYGHAEFGRGGGMEHQTLTSLGGSSQWLIAHELGHQWWGDLVTCASFHHIWLNEGFARFSEAIWEEAYNGIQAYKDYWQSHEYYGPGTIFVENPNSVGNIFDGNLSYNKAGWIVHMLRGVMGDSLFFESLQSYVYHDSLAYGAVTTEDFQTVCENVSGLDLGDFFQQWIYGEYYPQYAVSWEMLDTDELIVNIEQTQNWQTFRMPIQLNVTTPTETLSFTVENESTYETYNLGLIGADVIDVKLDPDNWILKDVVYLSIDSNLPQSEQLVIYPAYPNPFNPETTLSFFIPENIGQSLAKVVVYDLKGSLVSIIWDGSIQPGLFTLKWKPKNVASGSYFIRLTTLNTSYSQKVQLVK
jgi:aminopeptidase N